VAHLFSAAQRTLANFAQSLLKPCFFGRYFALQYRADYFAKRPKFVHGHRFKIMRFHFPNSDAWSLSQHRRSAECHLVCNFSCLTVVTAAISNAIR
jgi:hypothetical protein